MKKFDLVKLKNDRPYKSHNLIKDMHGIVVDVNFDNTDVLFFNPHNVGDYAIVNAKTIDLDLDKEEVPTEFEKELLSKLESLKLKAKNVIEPIAINEYDMVELLVEEENILNLVSTKVQKDVSWIITLSKIILKWIFLV